MALDAAIHHIVGWWKMQTPFSVYAHVKSKRKKMFLVIRTCKNQIKPKILFLIPKQLQTFYFRTCVLLFLKKKNCASKRETKHSDCIIQNYNESIRFWLILTINVAYNLLAYRRGDPGGVPVSQWWRRRRPAPAACRGVAPTSVPPYLALLLMLL